MTAMNAINHGGEHDVLVAAEEDHESVVELTRELVTIPSRGGVDPYDPVLDRLGAWLAHHNLPATVLTDSTGATVGLTCEVPGSRPGPRWVLDACLDTAPFGDERAWTHPPTSAVIEDGWLWGRGSADSKSGAAIFCHIAARLAAVTGQPDPRSFHRRTSAPGRPRFPAAGQAHRHRHRGRPRLLGHPGPVHPQR